MKFATLIFAALAATATAFVFEMAAPVPGSFFDVAAPVPALESDLEAVDCTPSRCTCNKVQGLFCGNQAINRYCTNGHVFECNRETGRTCDYGRRRSCANCGKLECP